MLNQMKSKIKSFLFLLACFMITGVVLHTPVELKATSANLTFSTQTRAVTVGDTFYVVIILDSSEEIGGFEGYISYNPDRAEFISGGGFVNGGDGLLRIQDVDSAEVKSTKKYSLKFKAKKTGDCTFETSEAPAVYNENGDELSVSSNKLNVTVKNSKKLSSNNELSKLQVSPGELNQSYNNDITAYKVTIPTESNMLFISAETKDKDAVVTVDGNENLEIGKNYVHVVVTAPSGAKRDIQIEVTREDKTAQGEKESKEVKTGISLEKDQTGQMVLTEHHTYSIVKVENEEMIPTGYDKSELTLDGESIEVYAKKEDQEKALLLLYLRNEKGEAEFYQFDRIDKTLQRFVNLDDSNHTKDIIQKQENTNMSVINIAAVTVAVMACIIIALTIALVTVIMKNKSNQEPKDLY